MPPFSAPGAPALRACPRASAARKRLRWFVAISTLPGSARPVPLVHARIARERCWIRRRPAGNCPLELLRACTPRLGACERGDSRVSEELRLTARAHVQTRPRACPIAGKTPSGAGNTIWRQADAASGRAVDCPTILRAIFFCGHLSTCAARASKDAFDLKAWPGYRSTVPIKGTVNYKTSSDDQGKIKTATSSTCDLRYSRTAVPLQQCATCTRRPRLTL